MTFSTTTLPSVRPADAAVLRTISQDFEEVDGHRYQNANVVQYGGERIVLSHRAILTIVMTAVCNAACKFCSNEVTFTPKGRFVAYEDELARVCDFAALGGVRKVAFTGGEPTLDPQGLLDTAGAVMPIFERARIHTNGSRIFEPVRADGDRTLPLMDALVEKGLSGLSVSVAHWDPEVNQQVMRWKRGWAGADDDLLRRIAGYDSASFNSRLSCVMTDESVRTPQDMVRFMDWGVSLGFRRFIFRTCSEIPDTFQLRTDFSEYNSANGRSIDQLTSWFEDQPGYELTYRQRKTDSKVDVYRSGDVTFDIDESSEEVDPDPKVRRINFMPDGVAYTSWLDQTRTLFDQTARQRLAVGAAR